MLPIILCFEVQLLLQIQENQWNNNIIAKNCKKCLKNYQYDFWRHENIAITPSSFVKIGWQKKKNFSIFYRRKHNNTGIGISFKHKFVKHL